MFQDSIANRSMCIFKGLKLKDPHKTMECINIVGYYVNCIEVDDIQYMEVELQEHKKDNEPGEIKRITPKKGRSLKEKYLYLSLDHLFITEQRELRALDYNLCNFRSTFSVQELFISFKEEVLII